MLLEYSNIAGLQIITPDVFEDDRGWFSETWQIQKYLREGIGIEGFVQDNHSHSVKNVIRGLHFQEEPWQGKLVRCTKGSLWDVAVDIRPNSPTYKKWLGVVLSSENHKQFWIPEGFAHGFYALEECELEYKVTGLWNKSGEHSINAFDQDIRIDWPCKIASDCILSEKDKNAPMLKDISYEFKE